MVCMTRELEMSAKSDFGAVPVGSVGLSAVEMVSFHEKQTWRGHK